MTFSQVIVDLIIRFVMNCPEEEFESLDRLFFQIEEAHWFYEDYYRENDKSLPSLSFKEFVDHVFEHCPCLVPLKEALAFHMKSFFQYKNTVPVYGAIILNQTRDKVLLVRGWTARSWSFPRGKINQGELETACAIREVKEEIGFDVTNYLNPKQFVKLNSSGQSIKLYIITEGIPENVQFIPQTKKEIRAIEWHSIDHILQNRRKSYVFVFDALQKLSHWLERSNKNNEQQQQRNNNKKQFNNRKRRIQPTRNT